MSLSYPIALCVSAVLCRRQKICENKMHQMDESELWYKMGRNGGVAHITPQECYYKSIKSPGFYYHPNQAVLVFYYLSTCGGYKNFTKTTCYGQAMIMYQYISEPLNCRGPKWLDSYYMDKVIRMALMGGGWLFDKIWCDSNTCYEFLESMRPDLFREKMRYYIQKKVRRERTLEKDIKNPTSWSNLAHLGGGTVFDREYTPAQCFEYAIMKNPYNYKYWYNLGCIGGSQKYEQRDCFIKAIELNKNHWRSWVWLAKLEDDLCKKQQYLKKTLEIWPNNRMALNNLKNIEWSC